MDHNVIAAYSGGVLPAAIGIVRLSGEGTLDVLSRIFHPRARTGFSERNKMLYGELSAADGRTLDLCMACVFRAPHSYTGEDMAELYTHGSEAVVAAALRACYAAGARPAEAGEFTKRAYLNGKMNLNEAEAVADLIYARTEQGAKNAAALLKGAVSGPLRDMRESLLTLISHFYAVCDYSDEDIEPFEYEQARARLTDCCARLDELYQGYLRSESVTEGTPVALIGRPNVGKSSLFNNVAGFDRAIVTAEAGTTRDVVDHRVTVAGRDLRLLDTAGLRQGVGEAETLGVRRSVEAARDAALIVAVFDGSEKLTDEDREAISLTDGKTAVAVLNKCDLGVRDDVREELEARFDDVLTVSAVTGEGRGALLDWLADHAPDFTQTLITGRRQAELIRQARDALTDAARSAETGMTADAFLLDAERGANLIGQVLGEDVDIDIAQGIFDRFCVGK